MKKRSLGVKKALVFLTAALVVYFLTLNTPPRHMTAGEQEKRITKEIPLSGGVGYIVYFGSYIGGQEARIACARYMNRGAAGYLMMKEGMYLAAGNLYDDEMEAGDTVVYLKESGVDCGKIEISADDALLRVTGTEKKIAALLKGYETYLQTEKELMKLSEELDADDISLANAALRISVIQYDARLAQMETEDIKKEGHVLTQMLAMLDEGFDRLNMINENADGEMMLSARIKHALIGMRLKRYEFLNSLQL